MEDSRSVSPIMPGDLKLSEQAMVKVTDLQRCIESLQRFICDLLIENEALRHRLAADKSLSSELVHPRGKDDSLCKPTN